MALQLLCRLTPAASAAGTCFAAASTASRINGRAFAPAALSPSFATNRAPQRCESTLAASSSSASAALSQPSATATASASSALSSPASSSGDVALKARFNVRRYIPPTPYVPVFQEFTSSPLQPIQDVMKFKVHKTKQRGKKGGAEDRAAEAAAPPMTADAADAVASASIASLPDELAKVSRYAEAIAQLRQKASITEDEAQTLTSVTSLATANTSERLTYEMGRVMEHYAQDKDHRNSGDTAVQVAILSLRINNILRHRAVHKQDKHAIYRLNLLKQKRRKLLIYLRRKNFDRYVRVMADFDIHEDEITLEGKDARNGNQLRRLPR